MDRLKIRAGRPTKYHDRAHLERKYRMYVYQYLKGIVKGGLGEILLGASRKKVFRVLSKDCPGFKRKWKIGNFSIDHIIPVSEFDLTDWKQVLTCFNIENIQPMKHRENARKSNKNYLCYILPVDCIEY